MEFQVSARKWRPQKFSELIGQEAIVRTLKNAIELDRLAHAYLFSGTRGVGKTTSARILAKALNCEQGPTADPCDTCTHCVEIRDGHSVDVLEIDGASNNGVAEVRELIDNVQYSTSSCRFKVYIIDEVHMLSKSAFNALLKTLEEPPPGVVFIFATTELTKIPETILSRCQCFEFKPLAHKQIIHQLDLICKNDGIEIDASSLEEIAKNGAGSMRDAQSLLDQVIAFCGKQVDAGSVESVLGIVGQGALESFVGQVIQKDGAGLIQKVQETAQQGKDLGYFCRDLIEYLRNLMIVKVAKQPETLLAHRSVNLEVLKQHAEALHMDEIQQMFAALSKAEADMKRSSLPQMIFEMAVLRMLDVRSFQSIDAMIETINTMEAPAVAPSPRPQSLSAASVASAPESPSPAATENVPPTPAPVPSPATPSPSNGSHWERIKGEAASRKRLFDHYLGQATLVFLDAANLHVRVPDSFTLDQVLKPENLEVLQEAVQQVCGYDNVKVKVDCNAVDGEAEAVPTPPQETPAESSGGGKKGLATDDKILKEALDIFGGTVIR